MKKGDLGLKEERQRVDNTRSSARIVALGFHTSKVIAEVKRGTCGKQKAENMALDLANRNKNGIKGAIRAGKGYRKEQRKKIGKHVTTEINKKRIFLMGSRHHQMSKGIKVDTKFIRSGNKKNH